MKTIIVTGGNRGIGLEICRQLSELGHTVILCSRDLEKGDEAARNLNENVIVKKLDVTKESDILNLFHFVAGKFGKLDVLINNAGINKAPDPAENKLLDKVKKVAEQNMGNMRKIGKKILPFLRNAGLVSRRKNVTDVPVENVKKVLDVNLHGPWRLMQVFLPLLQQSDDGRIINMSSGMGEITRLSGDYPEYRLSKTALNAVTLMFSKQTHDDGIKVNAMCPGWVRTDMGGPDAHREVSQGADTAVWLSTEDKIPTGKFFRDRKVINW